MIVYNIRLGTMADYTHIERMMFEFAEVTHQKDEIDKVKCVDRILWFLNDPNAVVLVLTRDDFPVGLLAGFKVEALFSKGTTAMEQAWWVDPPYRGSRWALYLPKLFEEWAIRQGCRACVLSGIEESSKVSGLYHKMGYEPIEYAFRKVF